jgi:hypothetical protein
VARRSVLDAILGMRHGGPVRRRDAGPWLVAWLAGGAAVVFGIFALAEASWSQGALALVLAAAAGGIAVRALALTRTEPWQPAVPGGFTDVKLLNGMNAVSSDGELLRDYLDLVDETAAQMVAQITDAEMEECIQETLERAGLTGRGRARGDISGRPRRKD